MHEQVQRQPWTTCKCSARSISQNQKSVVATFLNTLVLPLDLEHHCHRNGRVHRLEDEAHGKAQHNRKAKHGDAHAATDQGLDNAWDQQQTHCYWANTLEDLQVQEEVSNTQEEVSDTRVALT